MVCKIVFKNYEECKELVLSQNSFVSSISQRSRSTEIKINCIVSLLANCCEGNLMKKIMM